MRILGCGYGAGIICRIRNDEFRIREAPIDADKNGPKSGEKVGGTGTYQLDLVPISFTVGYFKFLTRTKNVQVEITNIFKISFSVGTFCSKMFFFQHQMEMKTTPWLSGANFGVASIR